MKKVLITKRCHYRPNGSKSLIYARPGQVVMVSGEDAEKMIAGNVAGSLVEPEPVKPKKAPVNRQKKVTKIK